MPNSHLYNYDYFRQADGRTSWNTGSLKFGDALAALAYAHGITFDAIRSAFPEVLTDERWEGQTESFGDRYIEKQIDFLNLEATRRPKNVLEIGGGRGDVAATLHHMNTPVTSIEPGSGAEQWYKETGQHFFGSELANVVPLNKSVEEAIVDINIGDFDTIIMVESLEHILEENFNPVWDKITKDFHGLFIVTNWLTYHPIKVGQYATKEEHCRLVDDALYDLWTTQARQCVFRNRSHLVLEF